MKSKKSTREAQGKKRLRQRLMDLAQGAMGHCFAPTGEDDVSMAAEMGIGAFGQWVGAIQRTFGSDYDVFDKAWMLENYDTLDSATEYLWERGVSP